MSNQKELYQLIIDNEDWLMERILFYARDRNYVMYTSTLKEAWRISIAGLSASLAKALKGGRGIAELGPNDEIVGDPIAAFGIEQAQKHRHRGVTLDMFLGLMKYYRQSYIDLLRQADFNREAEEYCQLYINRFFDRVEIGFCMEWCESTAGGEHLNQLRAANRAMTNEKNKYLTIFESISSPVILINKDNRVENVNLAAAEFFKGSCFPGSLYYGGEQSQESMDWLSPEFEQFMASGNLEKSFEKVYKSPKGNRNLLVKLMRMLDVSEKFTGTIAILNDVTLRKLSEDALRESEQKFRKMSACAQDAIIMIDNSGSISYWNDAATRILGFTMNEIIGRDIHEMLAPPRYQHARREGFKNFRLTGRGPLLNNTLELFAIRKDGAEIPVELSISSVMLGGKWNAIGILRDVTARNEMLKELKKAKEIAESASRTKSQFLANMSHELRTPLNAIIGFSEILGDQAFGQLNPRQARYVNNILTSGQHLLQLINDILDLSKIEAGRMNLDLDVFDPVLALHEVQNTIRPLADKKGIDLYVDAQGKIYPLNADVAKFKQIMFNLLSNSIKFTPEGGRVGVAMSLGPVPGDLEGPAEGAKSHLRVSVEDTGIGIKPQDQERIFSEFEQVDSSYARKQQGTGLGLVLTKKLVQLHRGFIQLVSSGVEGEGSIFTVWLPLESAVEENKYSHQQLLRGGINIIPAADEKAARPNEKEGKEEAITGCRGPRSLVLIVEDDINASELLTLYLSEAGYDVAHVFDGGEVLEKVREIRPQAITLDIMLPGKNGWEVLAELKNNPDTQEIPVILVSMTENRQLGLSLGAVDYLVKPVNKDILLDALGRTAQQEQ